ncbi:MAG: lipopolysaccharide biosynthesis protein [Rikenellaceae bacterium]|nr:lipopolysaccharide biosynthesis protein [Rikenellaceae bacterium]
MSEQSLKQKTIRGTAWSMIDSVANQGITFLVGLVLARLLTPEEYGLIGIIMIFVAVFNSIVDSGFSSALVRKTDVKDIDYNTVFITNLTLSFVLFFVMFFCAPWIAQFFHQPQLELLSKVMASIVIINAFAIIQRTILVKKIDFKTQTKISLIASLSSGTIGIVMALWGYGVWSLVGQQISRQLLNTLFLWVYAKWYPRLQFSKSSFKELFGFGWKLLASGLIDTVWREIYQVVIGIFYSPATLGQYTRAHQFSTIASSNLTAIVQRVSYPVLSSIQGDKERLKLVYKRVIKVTMLITFVLMLGMAAVAKPMILVLVGEQWLPCVPFLQIICFQMMLYPLHSLNLNMLQVQGRSDLFLRLEVIKKCVTIIPLLLGIYIDIYWMLYGSVVGGFFGYYLNAYYSGPFINYSIREQIRDIFPSFLIALFMFVCLFCISHIAINPFILLPIQIAVGASIVVGICELCKQEEYLEIKRITKSYLKTN